jgi:uncharacterized protein (DUF433 family)
MYALANHIIVDDNICNGKPVIKGTRISVSTVLSYISAGDSIADILESYPQLTEDDIKACLQYATEISNKSITIKPLAA